MIDVKAELTRFDLFDGSIYSHGFTRYARDYEIVAEILGDLKLGVEPGLYRYIFTHCVEAHITTQFDADNWRESWNDINLDYDKWSNAREATGYVWGVGYLSAYPGVTYIDDSERAADWSRRVGYPMHEILIATNVQMLRLLFHNVIVKKIAGADTGIY